MVVPTLNERGNIETLVERLRAALVGIDWRLIVVDDDSPDGTADLVKTLAARDPSIQCLRRVGRRGLAGAVIEGVLASASPFVAVIDGDLQHDERLLPRMLAVLRANEADLVIGSRYVGSGGLASGLSPIRRWGSELATWAARRTLNAQLTDPMSGFFMVGRERVEGVADQLSPDGFKILFDIVASQAEPPRIVEMPYAFGERLSGSSKLDGRVVADYAGLLLKKISGGIIPTRGLIFGVVASVGLSVQLLALFVTLSLGASFLAAQGAAAAAVLTTGYVGSVFFMRPASGRSFAVGYGAAWWRGAPGWIANLGVGDLLHGHGAPWWLAGLGGALIGAAWTYAGNER